MQDRRRNLLILLLVLGLIAAAYGLLLRRYKKVGL